MPKPSHMHLRRGEWDVGRGSHLPLLSLPGPGLLSLGSIVNVAAILFWGSMDGVAGKFKSLKLDEMKVF